MVNFISLPSLLFTYMNSTSGDRDEKRRRTLAAYRVVLVYFVISVIWILGSDTLLNTLTSDDDLILRLSIVKGAGFVIVTSILLYYLVSRELREAYELKQKDRIIKRRDDILRTLSDNFPKGSILLLDLNGRPLGMSETNIGLVPRDLNSRGMKELVSEAAAGTPGRIEIAEARGYFLVQAVPVRDDEDKVFSVLVIYEDITEIKRSEETLARKVMELGALFSISRSMLDSDEKGEMLSKACRQACEGLGLDGVRIFKPDDEHTILTEVAWSGSVMNESGSSPSTYRRDAGGLEWRAFEKGAPIIADGPVRSEEELRTHGARSAACLPLLKGGNAMGILSVYSREPGRFGPDEIESLLPLANIISLGLLKMRYIEEIERQKNDLEIRVEQRTQDLMEVNEQLDSFAHSISHDLQAPIRGMKGMAEAILEDFPDSVPEKGREYLVKIIENSDQLEALIQDTLTYSRIRRMELSTQPIDLRSTLEDALEAAGPEIGSTKAIVLLDAPNATVIANRTILKQVVLNLMTNAMKFTKKGERPEVRIVAKRIDGKVRISVIDKGIGISPADQARIFHPFIRLHSQEDYPGTGVGLAIVSKGVEKMAGTYGVRSEEGKGSEFWIELPEGKAF